jgi:hypothetical protein
MYRCDCPGRKLPGIGPVRAAVEGQVQGRPAGVFRRRCQEPPKGKAQGSWTDRAVAHGESHRDAESDRGRFSDCHRNRYRNLDFNLGCNINRELYCNRDCDFDLGCNGKLHCNRELDCNRNPNPDGNLQCELNSDRNRNANCDCDRHANRN